MSYNIFSNKAINLIVFGYKKIFDERPSEELETFIKNLTYVFTGTVIATVLSLMYNTISGRILGPTEYGNFVVIQSIATFMQIPMLFGLSTALIKYNAEKIEILRQNEIISTTYFLVFIFSSISISIFMLISSDLAYILSVEREIIYFAIVFSLLFVFYTLTSNTLTSLHQIKLYSNIQPIYSAFLLGSFLSFIIIANIVSFKSAVYSVYIANFIIGVLILTKIYKFLRLDISVSWLKTLLKYGIFTVFGDMSFVIYTNIDKILINKYMLANDVGLYNAYNYSSINLVNLLAGIFITVYFPTISKYEDKKPIFNKIRTIVPCLLIIGIPLVLVIEYVILNIYGEEYTVETSLILLFAVTSIMSIIYRLYVWTFNSMGVKGTKITLVSNGAIAVISIVLDMSLIPLYGLGGAITATLIGYFIGICIINKYAMSSK